MIFTQSHGGFPAAEETSWTVSERGARLRFENVLCLHLSDPSGFATNTKAIENGVTQFLCLRLACVEGPGIISDDQIVNIRRKIFWRFLNLTAGAFFQMIQDAEGYLGEQAVFLQHCQGVIEGGRIGGRWARGDHVEWVADYIGDNEAEESPALE